MTKKYMHALSFFIAAVVIKHRAQRHSGAHCGLLSFQFSMMSHGGLIDV